MTDTLQAEDDQPDDLETIQPESGDSVDPDQGDDQAPSEKKKVEFSPEHQEVFNNAMNDKVRETHNERRRADALQSQLDDINRNKPQEARPVVPNMPDSYDEDFNQKKVEYEQAIRSQQDFDTRQAFAQEQQQSAAQTQQNANAEAYNSSVGTYLERAKKLGMDENSIRIAGQAVRDSGMSPEIQMHIVNDASGPLIADFLSKNPVELGNLRNMAPLAQAAYIEGTIKPKASKTRKPTQAPDPANILSGNGSPPQQRGPKGATFQ